MRHFLLFGLLVYVSVLSAQEQEKPYTVLLSAFENRVPMDYFQGLDKEALWVEVDHNDLFRVYFGHYEIESDAENAAEEARETGYPWARVIDLSELRTACSQPCEPGLYVRNIFFDYDRADLRKQSRDDLDKLFVLLRDNPAYEAELTAHTDSHGNDEYNIDLSRRRAENARDYLVKKGVEKYRIRLSYSGELQPIARNFFDDGRDSPKGRQYNRRVEITVIDENDRIIPGIVEEIRVPDALRL